MKTVKEKSMVFLKATQGNSDLESVWQEIVNLYNQPTRYYHTLDGHVNFCLDELESAKSWIEQTFPYSSTRMNFQDFYCALGLTLILHDIVMDFGRHDNEEKSAVYAYNLLGKMGFNETIQEAVPNFIMCTKHLFPADTFGGKLVADIDLATFATDEKTWQKAEENIREEYSFVKDEEFKPGRKSVLGSFLAKKTIFQTDFFHKKCDQAAIKNLTAPFKKLS